MDDGPHGHYARYGRYALYGFYAGYERCAGYGDHADYGQYASECSCLPIVCVRSCRRSPAGHVASAACGVVLSETRNDARAEDYPSASVIQERTVQAPPALIATTPRRTTEGARDALGRITQRERGALGRITQRERRRTQRAKDYAENT